MSEQLIQLFQYVTKLRNGCAMDPSEWLIRKE